MFDVGSAENFGSSTLGNPCIVVEQAATMGNGLDLGWGGRALWNLDYRRFPTRSPPWGEPRKPITKLDTAKPP
jgi:hypothetical protein